MSSYRAPPSALPLSALARELAPLTERLDSARRRRQADRRLRVLFYSIALGFASFTLLAAGARLMPLESAPQDQLWPSAAAAVLSLLVGLFIVSVRQEPVAGLARRADAVFGLQERASAAVEAVENGPVNPLVRALVTDAAARADAVAPDRLVPVRWPRALAVAVVAALVAGLLMVVPMPVTPPGNAVAPVQAATIGEAARDDVAIEIRRAAEILARDAQERDDPLLEAVARELAQLEASVSAGELSDRRELEGALERLLQYASEGYRKAGEIAGGPADLSRVIEGALQALEPSSRREAALQAPAGADIPASRSAGAGDTPEQAGPGARDDYEHAEAGAAGGRGQGVLQGGGERPAESGADSAQLQECVHDGDLDCYLLSRPTEAESIIAEAAGEQAAGGVPGEAPGGSVENGFLLGPAPQSGSGESYEAGRGTETIGGGAGQDRVNFAAGAEVQFQNERVAGEGNRFRLDLAPEAAPQHLPAAGAADPQAWRRLPVHEIGRVPLAPQQRDVVARYFLSGVE
jgi:hypothetical protein